MLNTIIEMATENEKLKKIGEEWNVLPPEKKAVHI
jgi:hypothetical protein